MIINTVIKGSGGGSAVIDTLNVTPSTSAQTITASGGVDGYSPVNVAAVTSSIDANITAGNIKKDVTILGVTGSYEGGGSGGKYQFLQRVKDDTNTEIGTVVGFRKDSSNNEYAVVCLDARFRSDQWFLLLSSGVDVEGLDNYSYAEIFNAPETATKNCDLIIATATAQSLTCDAVTECRSHSFTINNTTYYGQLPSMSELVMIMSCVDQVNSVDPDKDNPTYEYYLLAATGQYWSSTQNSPANAWRIRSSATSPVQAYTKSSANSAITPILELPNA